jgi:hypothetical protein
MVALRPSPGIKGFALWRRELREFLKSGFADESSSFGAAGFEKDGYTGADLVSNSLGGSGSLAGTGFAGACFAGWKSSSSSSSSAPANRLETFFGGSF